MKKHKKPSLVCECKNWSVVRPYVGYCKDCRHMQTHCANCHNDLIFFSETCAFCKKCHARYVITELGSTIMIGTKEYRDYKNTGWCGGDSVKKIHEQLEKFILPPTRRLKI